MHRISVGLMCFDSLILDVVENIHEDRSKIFVIHLAALRATTGTDEGSVIR
jgi:hypothetical protein